MHKAVLLFAAAVSLAAFAGPAAGLTPAEVVVVVNSRSPESVELALTYAKLRGIPDENVVLLETTTEYAVGRGEYDQKIVNPLREALRKRGLVARVRCLALMWGVPVRVMGEAAEASGPNVAEYRTAATKAHYQLAVDFDLLTTVGREFPEPRTDDLTPLGSLFSSPIPAPAEPLTEFKTLQRSINLLLGRKQVEVKALKDERNRRIALRQVMALHLDMTGLKGLIRFLESDKPEGAPDLGKLRERLERAEKELDELRKSDPSESKVAERLKLMDEVSGAMLVYSYAVEKAGAPPPPAPKGGNAPAQILSATDAAVDSELAALWWPEYKLAGPLDNPLFWKLEAKYKDRSIAPTLMVARIDGPTAADAMRIVKASVETEKAGLRGNFYIDAGGKIPQYDQYLKNLHALVKARTKVNSVLDEQESVFQRNSCPQAALYVGWYSLRQYVPAFMWVPGAVGWHIASFEADDLRNPRSYEWCVKMIQHGVAVTIGPVAEPLLGSFPRPDEFFPLLLTGRYTVAECYWRSCPMLSWRMTLIADPLYIPFRANPQAGEDILPRGLAPAAD